MALSYFDKVSPEALSNIFRHLSRAPKRSDWLQHIDSADFHSVLLPSHPLGTAASERVKSIFTPCFRLRPCWRTIAPSPFIFASGYAPKESEEPETGERFQHGKELSDFSKILDCTRLHLTHLFFDMKRFPLLYPDLFTASFPALKVLGIYNDYNNNIDLEGVLQLVGGQLEELHVLKTALSAKRVATISKHCPGISRLSLNCLLDLADSETLWKALGPTLVHLSIEVLFRQMFVKYIKQYCKGLRSFAIQVDCGRHRFTEKELVHDLCIGLGEQLEYLEMPAKWMTPEFGKKFARACPNARVDMKFLLGSFPGLLIHLAPQISGLEIGYSAFDAPPEDFVNLSRCKNLKTLILSYGRQSKEVFEALFKHEKKLCCDFRMELRGNYDGTLGTSTLLDLLAEGTCSLRSVEMECEFLKPDAFKALASANRGLENITICILRPAAVDENGTSSPFTEEESIAGIVREFSTCPELRSLEVRTTPLSFKYDQGWDIVKNNPGSKQRLKLVDAACGGLKTRTVFVKVCDIIYVQ